MTATSQGHMIGMGYVAEVIKTVILSGRLANADMSPVSLLLISPPEHGKTSIILKHRCKSLMTLTDITGSGVKEIAEARSEISHIAILDLLMATSHRATVNQYLMAWINSVSEEGYLGEATPKGIRILDKPLKKGFICCLTPKMSKDGRHYWNKVGFTSRMLPFYYLHSKQLTEEIKARINNPPKTNNKADIDLQSFDVPEKPVIVSLPDERVKEISWLAEMAARQLNDPKGYRRLKQFRALACSHAILRHMDSNLFADKTIPEVELVDVEFIKEMMHYISYDQGAEL